VRPLGVVGLTRHKIEVDERRLSQTRYPGEAGKEGSFE
jgi:hypothetical protein